MVCKVCLGLFRAAVTPKVPPLPPPPPLDNIILNLKEFIQTVLIDTPAYSLVLSAYTFHQPQLQTLLSILPISTECF